MTLEEPPNGPLGDVPVALGFGKAVASHHLANVLIAHVKVWLGPTSARRQELMVLRQWLRDHLRSEMKFVKTRF